MNNNTCDCGLPVGLLRYMRAYKPRLRKYVISFFAERLANNPNPTMEQVQECLAAAYDKFLEELAETPREPEQATVSQALDDYRNGRWKPIEELIDAIPD